MALGTHFEHLLIRKYIAIFGTLFNNIKVSRNDKEQFFKVPLDYAPKEKYEAITNAKPGDQKPSMILPRMSFEMTGMSFDSTRKINREARIPREKKFVYRGAPWNINFQLNIIAPSALEATKIVEQILVNFQPDYTVDVKLLDGIDHIDRITTVYNSVSHQDMYEGEFEKVRRVIWTIDFTLKGWLYSNINDSKLIKYIDVRFHGSMNKESYNEGFTIQPGLTPDGKPTTDIDLTIPYRDIEKEDDWAFIVRQIEYGEN